jgi:hypothetical protein
MCAIRNATPNWLSRQYSRRQQQELRDAQQFDPLNVLGVAARDRIITKNHAEADLNKQDI